MAASLGRSNSATSGQPRSRCASSAIPQRLSTPSRTSTSWLNRSRRSLNAPPYAGTADSRQRRPSCRSRSRSSLSLHWQAFAPASATRSRCCGGCYGASGRRQFQLCVSCVVGRARKPRDPRLCFESVTVMSMPMLHSCAFPHCETLTLSTYCFAHDRSSRAELEAERAQLAAGDEPTTRELAGAPQAAA